MVDLKRFFILAFFVFLINFDVQSQTYINREWVNSTSSVNSEINRSTSLVHQGNLYVTSNIITGGGDTDVMTIAYSNNGDTLWVKTQSGSLSGGNDYGINLAVDPWGDIIVTAAVENSTTGHDYTVFHYDGDDGTLNWSQTWNGAGNGVDIPADIKVDGSGNTYVAGGSEATDGFSDYAIVKFSPVGTILWSTTYDYNDLHDAATSLSLGSKIVVTGGSAAGIGDWDIATLKLNPSTGAIEYNNRSDIAGATMVEANAMIMDEENNIYITGFAEIGGLKNIQTIKLDSALNLEWIANYEGIYNDVGNDIDVDLSGNVYITGYSELGAEKLKAITIKYANNGDTLWTKLYGNTVTQNGAIARKLDVQDNGDVYIAGSTSEATSQSGFLFFKYDTYGKMIFSETFQADTLDDDGFDVNVDDNEVYVTGFTKSLGSTNLTSLKYSLKEKDTTFFWNDSTGVPVYVKNDLIIRIDEDYIKNSKIDQLENEFWTPEEIFETSFVDSLNAIISNHCSAQDCPVTIYRVFRKMRTTDTISITRGGDSIRVPQFWATLLFEFSDDINIAAVADEISSLFPMVKYVNYNLIGHLDDVPDDEYYNAEQISLHSDPLGFWDDNHINVEPAWNYETGKRHIKVGVFDSPVAWKHEDFGGEDSTKVNGWDFVVNESIYTAESGYAGNHGTGVAGIVGAIRNNEVGIAGIAGGSYASGENLDSSGVAVYGMNIVMNDFPIVSHIADAVYNSSYYNPLSDYGYGLHVMNNSWGVSNAPYYGNPDNPWFIDTNIVLLTEAFHFANRNQVTVVASRGNSGVMQDEGTYHYNYPGVLDDNWVICVGGTGTDGNYHNGVPVQEYGYKTSRGWEIDVSAASCGSHNWTMRTDNNYNTMNGTSAAAPHAAGVAGLLLSYLNEDADVYGNLAPEDVEHILQVSALDTDITGVDSLTGYGIIDAGQAFYLVDKDSFKIVHLGFNEYFPEDYAPSPIFSNVTVTLSERYENQVGEWFLPDHPYVVNIYSINAIPSHTIDLGYELFDAWPRHSSSNLLGFPQSSVLTPHERINLIYADENEAQLTGYIYEVKDTLGNFLGWWPFDPGNSDNIVNMEYTLHLVRDDFVSTSENESNNSINVYPNPSTAQQTIILNFDQPIDGSIRLLDMNGRMVMNIFDGHISSGRTSIDVNIEHLPSGVYFYTITADQKNTYRFKILKQ